MSKKQHKATKKSTAKDVGRTRKKPESKILRVVPATDNQRIAVGLLEDFPVVIMEGLAGTGKTYLAVNHALRALFEGKVDKIIFTRPLTTVGNEKMGFLPGDINEKTKPYQDQLLEYVEEFAPFLNMEQIQMMQDQVEFIPIAYLRGRNFRNSIVIADEMQNSSQIQMKTLTTRMSEGSQLILLGDTKQEDNQRELHNGLSDLMYRLHSFGDNEFIGHVKFEYEDIQRGEFVKFLMKVYGDV